jgi:hypothetical protein
MNKIPKLDVAGSIPVARSNFPKNSRPNAPSLFERINDLELVKANGAIHRSFPQNIAISALCWPRGQIGRASIRKH